MNYGDRLLASWSEEIRRQITIKSMGAVFTGSNDHMRIVGSPIIRVRMEINDEHSMFAVLTSEFPGEGPKLSFEGMIDMEFH
jgi:hypothetical protein